MAEAQQHGKQICESDHLKSITGERPSSRDAALQRRIEKLSRITGRRPSVEEIAVLLTPENPEDAKRCADMLVVADKLRRKFGTRPVIERSMSHRNHSSIH